MKFTIGGETIPLYLTEDSSVMVVNNIEEIFDDIFQVKLHSSTINVEKVGTQYRTVDSVFLNGVNIGKKTFNLIQSDTLDEGMWINESNLYIEGVTSEIDYIDTESHILTDDLPSEVDDLYEYKTQLENYKADTLQRIEEENSKVAVWYNKFSAESQSIKEEIETKFYNLINEEFQLYLKNAYQLVEEYSKESAETISEQINNNFSKFKEDVENYINSYSAQLVDIHSSTKKDYKEALLESVDTLEHRFKQSSDDVLSNVGSAVITLKDDVAHQVQTLADSLTTLDFVSPSDLVNYRIEINNLIEKCNKNLDTKQTKKEASKVAKDTQKKIDYLHEVSKVAEDNQKEITYLYEALKSLDDKIGLISEQYDQKLDLTKKNLFDKIESNLYNQQQETIVNIQEKVKDGKDVSKDLQNFKDTFLKEVKSYVGRYIELYGGSGGGGVAGASGAAPAGTGSEVQFRSNATTFGAINNSSVNGGSLTLGANENLSSTPTAYFTIRNTTSASAVSQQVSPSIVLEGQGWKTDSGGASQPVKFRHSILPVQGTANPSVTYLLQSEINNSGTFTNRITASSLGVLTVSGDSNTITIDAKDSSNNISATRHMNITPGNGWTLFLNSKVEVASSSTFGLGSDVLLARDAANTLAMRNGTTPQTLRVYNTYTSATTAERATIGWSSNILQIGTEKGSAGGVARAMSLITDGIERIGISASGVVTAPSGFTAGRWSVVNNGNGFTFRADGSAIFGARGFSGVNMHPNYAWGWGSNVNDLGEPQDLSLWRDAAGILHQRVGTSAQQLRVANTYTSSTSGEWATIDWKTSSNILRIGTEKGSVGGASRPISFITGGVERANIGATGDVTITSLSAGGIVQSTNGVLSVVSSINLRVNTLRVDTSTTVSILSSDEIVVCNNSNPIVVTLPPLSSVSAGRIFDIKNKGTGMATISGVDALIDGATSFNINQYDSMRVTTDSTDWLII